MLGYCLLGLVQLRVQAFVPMISQQKNAAAAGQPIRMNASEEIERACEKLILALADYTDRGDYEAALGLFTDDAVMDRDGERFVGIESLRAAYAARPQNRVTCHILSNIAVEASGAQAATSRAMVTVYRHRGSGNSKPLAPYPLPGPETIGEYRDRFVLTPSRWRFAERITRTMFQAATAARWRLRS